MDFTQLAIVAVLVEAIWENIKMVYKDNKFSVSMIGSLIISIIICIITNVDIFTRLGFNNVAPIVGNIFTGVICSRGANLVSDIFSRLQK